MPKPKLKRVELEWSSDLAYTVGLITADGCLSPDGRHISLTSTDLQLLDTFKKCLNKTNKISDLAPSNISKKPAYRIQFGDVVFYDWLVRIGLCSRKSLVLGRLQINDKFFADFLRGYLDGDGSFTYYKDYYNTHLNPKYIYDRFFVEFTSSSKKYLVWVRKKTEQLISIKGSMRTTIIQNQLGKSPVSKLKYSTKEAIMLANWIYYQSELPCLQRKLDKARPFLNW